MRSGRSCSVMGSNRKMTNLTQVKRGTQMCLNSLTRERGLFRASKEGKMLSRCPSRCLRGRIKIKLNQKTMTMGLLVASLKGT